VKNARRFVPWRFAAITLCLVVICLLTGAPTTAGSQRSAYPDPEWQLAKQGLAPAVQRRVDEYVRALDTTGLMIVQRGRVVYQYGDLQGVSYIASARKSVLAILYGPYVANGTIRLDRTLNDLGMSDIGGLLPSEERARVVDLVSARSGVYHPASYPGDSLAVAPPRGSQEPGSYWLYSNWDFDAAGAAFERMTGKDIYDALRDDLAIPTGMQDFHRERQHKEGDLTRSLYPAYPMWLSTRDMARMGYLMLRHGRWRDRQLIPREWVKRITSVVTPRQQLNPAWQREEPFGYGYLWWVWDKPFAAGAFEGAYTAWGMHGQAIAVLPKLDMVIAHKTLPVNRDVPLGSYLRLLDRIVGKAPASEEVLPVLWRRGEQAAFARYEHLKMQPGNYIVSESDLYAAGVALFRRGQTRRSEQVLSLNARLYPGSVRTLIALSRSQAAAGETPRALETVRKALSLQPKDGCARVQYVRLGGAVDGRTAVALPVQKLRPLTGAYLCKDRRYVVDALDGHLRIRAYQDGDLTSERQTFAEADGRFFAPADGTLIRFEAGANDVAVAMDGSDGTESWRATRLASVMTTETQPSPAGWAKATAELMARGEIPGLSIAVIREGKIVWKQAFGQKNAHPSATSTRDGRTDGPVRDDTLFPAASMGKPVFAYIALRLVDRGILDLDRPLYEYLPNPRLEQDDRYKRITARMVLTHSSGLPNWGGTPLKLLFAPGEQFSYSGEGFVYLQAVVEKLTGQSLEALAKQEVFGPLRMTHTTYAWSPALAGNLVSGKLVTDYPETVHNPHARAADSLLTTPEDYARFVLAIINGTGLKPETAERMLTPQIRAPQWMFTPQIPAAKREAPSSIYWGLGWGLEERDAGRYFWHTGDNEAWRCFVIASREKQEGLVYFTNTQDGLSIVSALVTAILGGKHPSVDWIGYDQYDSPRIVARKELIRVYEQRGAQAGLTRYCELRKRSPGVVDESFTHDIGYYLRNHGEMHAAIAVFQENVRNYPESISAYDALSWAYLLANRVEPALASNEKALALDPTSAVRQARIAWLHDYLLVQKEPARVPLETLQRYVGNFTDRQVTLKEGTLYCEETKSKKSHRLIPLSAHTFALADDVSMHLLFTPIGGDRAYRLVVSYMPGW
jgi:CubicO group peptidase (beta-lactamase class C family)/Flp pilus assembly protein TadD